MNYLPLNQFNKIKLIYQGTKMYVYLRFISGLPTIAVVIRTLVGLGPKSLSYVNNLLMPFTSYFILDVCKCLVSIIST